MLEGMEGKVAVVTGAGAGLGRSHALELGPTGREGHGQRLRLREANPADGVVDEIKAAGGDALAHAGDVADWEQSKAMVRLAIDTYGSLDILVNNAGVLRDRMIFNMCEEEWDTVIRVHLKGHFCPLRHAAEYWRDEVEGRRRSGVRPDRQHVVGGGPARQRRPAELLDREGRDHPAHARRARKASAATA